MHRFVVHEDSMQPTLSPGDRLLARHRAPEVGDVVVFREPLGERFYIKRVAATGGSTVSIHGSTLTISDTRGARSITLPHTERGRSWTLLDNEVFVLSDDLEITRADSRVLGPVDTDGMYVAAFRYAPLGRLGRVPRR